MFSTHHEADEPFPREYIEAQQQRLSRITSFPRMRFEHALEEAFAQFRYLRLIKRVPIIGLTGLVLFCVFSILDFYSLPVPVYSVSIPIRLLLICPLILILIWLAKRVAPANLFMNVYVGVYLIAGIAIIAIIYTAGKYAHYLPYDGILLHLVFGYFLMGMPYMLSLYAGLMVSAIYILMSTQMNLPLEQLASNSIFILCLNFIGAIGCYMQERARRFLFLNEKLVALAKAKDKTEIASKTRLVATASHDLRQPLHAMHLLTDTLLDKLPEGESRGLVKSLSVSVKQLSQLFSTLMDISKLNAGIIQPKSEKLNLSRKLAEFSQEQKIRANELGIEIRTSGDESVWVNTDHVLFDRIIRNLLENIFVHAQATKVEFIWQVESENVRLDIKDNGKGIALEDQKVIFEEFQQTSDSAKTGMGLGLTIVKQLAELQSIPFGLDSELGNGASFWLRFPRVHVWESEQLVDVKNISVFENKLNPLPQQWSKLFEKWGYHVNWVRFEHELLETSFEALLPNTPQVILCGVVEQSVLEDVFNNLVEHQSRYPEIMPVLLLSDDTHIVERDSDFGVIEIVNADIRPARLRLIIEHLQKGI